MTTINNLTIEQMREIVDVAPTWAIWWCVEKKKFLDFIPCSGCLVVEDLRTAIAQHDREFKIGDHIRYMGIDRKSPHPEIFEVVGFDSMPVGGNGYKIKNRLGQIDFCYGDNYALVNCDTTDHVTDIRNHVSLSTRVVDL